MRVAIYARVSTQDQSLDSQLHELRDFAERRKFEIFREYVEVVSSMRDARPEFKALMLDAHARRFDCLLVWKYDRLSRSLWQLIETLKTLDAQGIQFISTTQSIDTTTPMGKLFFNIVGSFAEFEREIIVERTRAGLAQARRNGRLPGPKRDRALEARVRQLRHDGLSLSTIAVAVKRSRAGVLKILRAQAGGNG